MSSSFDTLWNQFTGTLQQTTRRKAICIITINGLDVTDRLDPYLISVDILDDGWPNCIIELDDRDGRLPIPPLSSPVTVVLGWTSESAVVVFAGETREIESGFGRTAGGRRLWVTVGGTNTLTTQIKAPMQGHWGEGAPPGKEIGDLIPFSQVIQDVAASAGATAQIHPELGAKTRDYWAQANESALHYLERMAGELGAVFRTEGGNNFVFTKPGEDPDGNPTVLINATWGDNLIAWKIQPFVARSLWGEAKQQYFSSLQAKWTPLLRKFGLSVPFGLAQAAFALPAPAPNASTGEQHNQGASALASFASGWGRIITNGEPLARFNCHVLLSGARAGVDGLYVALNSVEHKYSRQGYVTTFEVTPAGNAPATDNIGREGYGTSPPAPPNAPGGDVPANNATNQR
jgi:hypothetical protein